MHADHKPFSMEDLKQQYLLGQVAHINNDLQWKYYFGLVRSTPNIEENFEIFSSDMRKFNDQTSSFMPLISVTHNRGISKKDFDKNQIPITSQEYDVCFKSINYSAELLKQTNNPSDKKIIADFIYRKALQGNILEKSDDDAFESGHLDKGLKRAGIKTILLSGSFLKDCIAATGYSGIEKGYNVVFLSDLIRSHKIPSKELAVSENISFLQKTFGSSASALCTTSNTVINVLDIPKFERKDNSFTQMVLKNV